MPFDSNDLSVRALHPGMGVAVAERTVLRKVPITHSVLVDVSGVSIESEQDEIDAIKAWVKLNGHEIIGEPLSFGTEKNIVSGQIQTGTRYEHWGEVAARVATGNALLCPANGQHTYGQEKMLLERHIGKATLLMSGRHLQHGDAEQPRRNLEVFSNCATSPTSFLLFMLLLNGSGVGRCYDDDMMLTNWDNAPNLRVVLSTDHPDFDWNADESLRDAKHKYAGENVVWHEVADTREGWAKAIEIWETMAFQKIHRDTTLVLDFSKVRPRGSPIKGMQNRPSSGPKPLMGALSKIASIKGSGMPAWKQVMYVDHYLAECVLVGGARRAARMATKHWKDRGILEFIKVKRPIEFDGMSMENVLEFRANLSKTGKLAPYSYLWSSNNSVCCDAEFWSDVKEARDASAEGRKIPTSARRAWAVLNALAEAAYGDGTGEPGIINVDKLRQNDEGWDGMLTGDYVGSAKYTVDDDTKIILARLAKVAKGKTYRMITNPCGEISLIGLGGYCVIADVVPFHCDTLDEAEDAMRVATRALMRVNTMDNLYSKETLRTNRIGVGMTGVHEFAWKFFKIGFRDLVRPDFHGLSTLRVVYKMDVNEVARECEDPGIRSAAFWLTLARFSRAVQTEARSYAAELGVAVPHTVTTIKPAGTTSKLFGLTEGWHLPAMAWYMRWVQFRSDDPLVQTYKDMGYRSQTPKSYTGTTIIGFPTQPAIGDLGMGDALVTASQATPEDQYEWLKLGERFWIVGTDEECIPLHQPGADMGNQISYTLKYDPSVTKYPDFLRMLIEQQSQIRCCSVLPVTDTSAYEYLPEQALSKADYEAFMREVRVTTITEEVGFEHIDCGTGGCPIEFDGGSKLAA